MTPLVLIVLDGWGLAPEGPGNAVTLARTPNFDHYRQQYPHTELQASGRAVGLPEGQMGNSEVGHMNLGAGRVVMQSLTYIQDLIERGAFFENEALDRAFGLGEGRALHLMGLVSSGGVHSDLGHLFALLELAARKGAGPVYVHAFTDGRDVPPDSGKGFVSELEAHIGGLGCDDVMLATVSGRYYAMDRDGRWDRVKLAYDAIVCGEADHQARSGVEAVRAAYERGESDEFVKPTVLIDPLGKPRGPVSDGDSVMFFNFRADRARELSYALLKEDFGGFTRCRVLRDLNYTSLMRYADDIDRPHAFELPKLELGLAEVLSAHGKRQYHSAETEKYPHVTYFFNAAREVVFEGEERRMVPSPKVATYDLQPEMSAPELSEATLARLRTHDDDFILINYANPDMVGHTGVLAAAVRACEAADEGLGRIVGAILDKGGAVLVSADHGNAEVMIAEGGGPHTAHTTNPVPLIVVGGPGGLRLRGGGKLGDVAPTILALMGLPQPEEMTGRSLLEPEAGLRAR
ncbi:MAG: 2,3-bisphosphoglycerate-independent phosphoglycerate mutase [Deinococcota bacterium]|nr:2,3-bisphosphoglycerate-independent phosphoglycerate mutase [Deinococcota bacterium]